MGRVEKGERKQGKDNGGSGKRKNKWRVKEGSGMGGGGRSAKELNKNGGRKKYRKQMIQ